MSDMSSNFQPLDLNGMREEDMLKKMQLIQSGNMTLDINNNTPYPMKGQSFPNGPKIKMGSTFKDYNYGE
jgi:hypothetical protein